jgi:mannose-1-phosphate guanylyltransferase
VVCNENHRFLVAEQIKEKGSKEASIILEPCGRNTAPALTVAALRAAEGGANPLLLVMPADQVIEDQEAFQRVVARG